MYEGIIKEIKDVENERFERLVKKDRKEEFMQVSRDRNGLIDEFDEELWNTVIEKVKVYEGGKVVVVFKDGIVVERVGDSIR
ncbi:hypothetical protein PL321_11840 [Caloramator sp. mosi_1]|uniref:hypothetical protein n=1 Tax=Caloramator sp. mosi_1 TaxID=3023090 RepID=UPI00235F7EBF|nr:hypothetical protein [Caloramator sp. mosi_1]WDC83428.1 hypothetical protein PL321_11840 [Caloramator sp. mosi_1]